MSDGTNRRVDDLGAEVQPAPQRKVWVAPAITQQDLLETVAGTCTGTGSKNINDGGCGTVIQT